MLIILLLSFNGYAISEKEYLVYASKIIIKSMKGTMHLIQSRAFLKNYLQYCGLLVDRLASPKMHFAYYQKDKVYILTS